MGPIRLISPISPIGLIRFSPTIKKQEPKPAPANIELLNVFMTNPAVSIHLIDM